MNGILEWNGTALPITELCLTEGGASRAITLGGYDQSSGKPNETSMLLLLTLPLPIPVEQEESIDYDGDTYEGWKQDDMALVDDPEVAELSRKEVPLGELTISIRLQLTLLLFRDLCEAQILTATVTPIAPREMHIDLHFDSARLVLDPNRELAYLGGLLTTAYDLAGG
jgi:hypothetical protein